MPAPKQPKMTDTRDPSFQAFRLLASKQDAQMPGGLLKVQWLAVTKGARQAEAAVRSQVDLAWEIALLASGQAVMDQARILGLRDGDVTAL